MREFLLIHFIRQHYLDTKTREKKKGQGKALQIDTLQGHGWKKS